MKKQSSDENEQAWAAWNAEAIKVLNQAYDVFLENVDPLLWQNALRFALDARQAAERCPRRGCPAARACQLRLKPGTPLDCGAGLNDETLVEAARLALFGHLALFNRWRADMVGSAEEDDAS
jgi:hypothetical protein